MFGEMTLRQRAIIAKMLELPFPGREALAAQLATARVQAVHPDQGECFDIEVSDRAWADALSNRPVQLSSFDATGCWDYYLCVEVGEGLAYCVEAVRSGDDAALPDLVSMVTQYQQRGMFIVAPCGVLVPGYVPSGLEVTGSSRTLDEFSFFCQPRERTADAPSLSVRQGPYFESKTSAFRLVGVRGHEAKAFFDDGFEVLEWYESPDLLISIRSRGVSEEEVVRVAESLRPATSEG